ncbi:MAG: M24 family metallopeptidase [Parvibaculaceae bacterium]
MNRIPPRTGIDPADFAERRRKAAARAREEGLAGLLICGRGGGAVDRYGDIAYLTDHYSPFPYIPDVEGRWTGRAHSFLVLPVNSAPRLVVDIPYIDKIVMPADEIVVADLVIETTIAALKARGLASGRVGLVGNDTIALSMYRKLAAGLPDVEWVDADHILAGLRAAKSPGEIGRLRAASRLGSRMIEAMMAAAVPGATHGEVLQAGLDILIPSGGILYNSFMASGTGGANSRAVRANFPTWSAEEPLSEGQWFRAGISGVLHGYYFDLARARPIGRPQAEQVEAFEAAIAVVEAGIATIRPGVTAGDVAEAGIRKQQELGYPLTGVFTGLGHGVGLGWDSPWLNPGEPTKLVPGMVLCVEKTLSRGGYLGDFEETVLVTEHGGERITDATIRWW